MLKLSDFLKLINEVERELVAEAKRAATMQKVKTPREEFVRAMKREEARSTTKQPVYSSKKSTESAVKHDTGNRPLKYVNAVKLPDVVHFDEEKRTTTLVWYQGDSEPVVSRVKALQSDKFDARIGFLEAWFKATRQGMTREEANKYLDYICNK